jgi:glycosyltransferase involved in cell wall biosynthesis
MSHIKEECLSTSNVALAFVGTLVPDETNFHNSAFSRAGNMYQENLITGLSRAGLPPDTILSQHPMASFPRGKLWFRGRKAVLTSGIVIRLVGFINLVPLRILTVGLAVLLHLLRWGWHTRHQRRIVYTYNLTEPPGLFTLVAARIIGAKALAAVVDINVPGNTVPATLARRSDFWLQQRLLSQFDGLIVVNDTIISDFVPGATFVRIEGGVSETLLSRFQDRSAVADGQNELFTIVSAGSLDEANGVVELLEAFALLDDSRYRLMIAGAGPLEGLVREAAERNTHIKFCGFLSFDEVIKLYNTADVLVNIRLTQRLNTRYFFPSKMMEYLGSGIPVITTATGHAGTEYKDFVFLLLDETAESLAEMIRRVAALDPEARRDLGKRAQEYVRHNLTWEAQGRRLVQFIEEQL